MKAYIKQTTESSSFEQARIGFIAMGYECIYYKDTPQDLSYEDTLVGYITDVHKAFKHLNLEIPQSIDYPQELAEYFGRKIEKIQFNDIFQLEYPYFIKPTKYKQFAGKVIDLIGVKDTELYYTEDILNIMSEYRVFIQNKEIIGIKHYKGNLFISPDEGTIINMIHSYNTQPNTYALDVGVCLKNNKFKTILLEVNDG